MKIKDKVSIITGAAGGIGKSLAERFAAEGAKESVLADINADAIVAVTNTLGARGVAHIYTARAVATGMVERRSGYLVNTVSVAGILIQMDSVAYTVSKHAAIGLAEFLAAKYWAKGRQGIRPVFAERTLHDDSRPRSRRGDGRRHAGAGGCGG